MSEHFTAKEFKHLRERVEAIEKMLAEIRELLVTISEKIGKAQ
jgi:hypothetical protein